MSRLLNSSFLEIFFMRKMQNNGLLLNVFVKNKKKSLGINYNLGITQIVLKNTKVICDSIYTTPNKVVKTNFT